MPERPAESTPDPAVDTLIAQLASPREGDIQRLRSIIRATDARITESVNWCCTPVRNPTRRIRSS